MGNTPLEPILFGKIIGGSGGGSVTAEDIVTATGSMTEQQASDTRDHLDAETKKLVVTVTYNALNDEYSADKTFAEIEAAFSVGATILVLFGDYSEDAAAVYTLTGASEGASYQFTHVWVHAYLDSLENRQTIIADTLSVDDTDFWEFANAEYQPTLYKTLNYTSGSFGFLNNSVTTFGEMSSLTISSFPATGDWAVKFVSGSTATVLTVPNTLHMPDGFAVEANKRYEINVSDGYALVASWSTT